MKKSFNASEYRDSHKAEKKIHNDNRVYERDRKRRVELIKLDPRRYLLNTARRRARKYNREFTITVEDIKVPNICPVLGLELTVLNTRVPAPNSASVDRIDNNKGYIPGNIEVISYRANTLKKDGTVEEFEALIQHMKKVF